MFLLYSICLLPLIIGFILWLNQEEITWLEWIGGTVLGFITVGIIHLFLVNGLTSDKEILSGFLIKATYHPEWIEEYQQPHTICHSTDKSTNCHTYYTTEHRTHHRYWNTCDTLGVCEEINIDTFKTIKNTFNNINTENGHKFGFDGGDPNIYVSYNKKYVAYFPTNMQHNWTNIIKATQSNFSFIKTPKEHKTISYPYSDNWMISKRLIGVDTITIHDWDKLNAELGQSKHVNLIMVNFKNKDKQEALILESVWLGGKQNDLILCYGENWSYVFGWTENMLVKRNLETILLENKIDKNILPLIKSEVIKNYTMKDFKKFNYMQITPPLWAYILTFIITFIIQTIYWIMAYYNEYDK